MTELKSDAFVEKAKGAVEEGSGRLKDAAGGLTGDLGLQAEGKVDQLAGMARQEFTELYEEGESKLEQAVLFVQDRPLMSVGIAAFVGMLLGLILLPRRKAKA
ncbi:CsbD family protein [Gluconacetobacter tumulisoli]|uniref:CsbD family protein n=1 Tax=Gluconacetobacter tumulisoli TaxID=1286189 RepID=A0A7W4K4U9_9PROT|nr:CsbD family protein [Gluconacetobacter tumulisoli]MBB2200235.1 CsbD family protein [Gluconacetobacter tumulisoli]